MAERRGRRRAAALLGLTAALLAGCGGGATPGLDGDDAPFGTYKLGSSYTINGRRYYPEYDPAYVAVGEASWYGDAFDGLDTANGETFDKGLLTAAHPTLPLPSIVRVTTLATGRSLIVRVNDRGPFVDGRLIDLSQAAARELGFEEAGVTPVRVEFLRLAAADGTPPAAVARVARRTAPRATRGGAARTSPASPLLLTAASGTAGAACAAPPRAIQVAAYADDRRAEDAAASLRANGLPPAWLEAAGDGSPYVRVRLGPVEDDGEAGAVLLRLRRLGYDGAYVVPATAGAPVVC